MRAPKRPICCAQLVGRSARISVVFLTKAGVRTHLQHMTRPRDDFEITPDILLRAYSIGLFPMAESAEDQNLFWIDPEARGVFPLDAMIVSKSLAKTIRSEHEDDNKECPHQQVGQCRNRGALVGNRLDESGAEESSNNGYPTSDHHRDEEVDRGPQREGFRREIRGD